jgi:hypothetical protein
VLSMLGVLGMLGVLSMLGVRGMLGVLLSVLGVLGVLGVLLGVLGVLWAVLRAAAPPDPAAVHLLSPFPTHPTPASTAAQPAASLRHYLLAPAMPRPRPGSLQPSHQPHPSLGCLLIGRRAV